MRLPRTAIPTTEKSYRVDAAIQATGELPEIQCILVCAFSGKEYEEDLNSYITNNFTRQPKVEGRNVHRLVERNDRRPYRRKIRLKRYIKFQTMFKNNKKQLAIVNPKEDSIRAVYQRMSQLPRRRLLVSYLSYLTRLLGLTCSGS